MHRETETSSADIRNRILQRGSFLLDPFNKYIQSELGEGDIRGDFLLDGSPIVSQDSLHSLPPPLKLFFVHDRIFLPPVFHGSLSGESPDAPFIIRGVGNKVALRGIKFYGADGKYQWGPDELHALSFLKDNLIDDHEIMDELMKMHIHTRDEYLIKVAAWDYVRNDLSAAYYLKRSQHALAPTADDGKHIELLEAALEAANTGYFDTLILQESHVDGIKLKNDLDKISGFMDKLTLFVNEHSDLDIVRAHRELGNPQALLFAFHLMYETNAVAESDVIIAPLYGAVDIGEALKYLMKYGDTAYEIVSGHPPTRKAVKKPILYLHHKIGHRGKPRSETEGVLKSLATRLMILDATDDSLKNQITQAKSILCVDDSVGTFGSRDELFRWIHGNFGNDKKMQWVSAHAGIRWAKAQNASPAQIGEAETIVLTPVTARFKKPTYAYGSAYMPDKLIADMAIRTERTIIAIPELIPVLNKLKKYGVLDGIGYDLYETLVKRTVSRKERRSALHAASAKAFFDKGFTISPDEYGLFSRPIWLEEIDRHAKNNQEIDFHATVGKMVKGVIERKGFIMTIDEADAIANEICQKELEYELAVTVPDKGVLETLEYFAKTGIPQGVYSNTPYPKLWMDKIMVSTGLSDYIGPQQSLFSSDTGIIKPAPETMHLLAGKLDIAPSKMAFVGNSKADIGAAMRGRAIPVWRLFPGENPEIEKRLVRWRLLLSKMEKS